MLVFFYDGVVDFFIVDCNWIRKVKFGDMIFILRDDVGFGIKWKREVLMGLFDVD